MGGLQVVGGVLSTGTGVFLLNFRNIDRGSRSGSFVNPAGLSCGSFGFVLQSERTRHARTCPADLP
jgi:hypothetical protein